MKIDEFEAISTRTLYGKRYEGLPSAIIYLVSSDIQNEVEVVIISTNADPQIDQGTFDKDDI